MSQPKPTSFLPVFNPTVFIGFGPYACPINPVYCLMPPSADILVAILQDLKPIVESNDPQLNFQRWHYSQQVPWLKFPDGTLCNAGQLADYWRARPDDTGKLIAPDFSTAERNCRADIDAAIGITRRYGFNIEV